MTTDQFFRKGKVSDYTPHSEELLEVLRDFFDSRLKPDYYDVRRDQIELIVNRLQPEESTIKKLFQEYYQPSELGLYIPKNPEIIVPYFEALSPEDQAYFSAMTPYRERAYSQFHVALDNGQATMEVIPSKGFVQESDDYRNQPRIFEPISSDLLNHPQHTDLVSRVASSIQNLNPDTSEYLFDLHAMRLNVQADNPNSNTPEGPHRDGSQIDGKPTYGWGVIVSRENVEGAQTRAFQDEDGKIPFGEPMIVGAGEFMFFSDSTIYHDGAPAKLINPNKRGFRDLFGYDISVIK